MNIDAYVGWYQKAAMGADFIGQSMGIFNRNGWGHPISTKAMYFVGSIVSVGTW